MGTYSNLVFQGRKYRLMSVLGDQELDVDALFISRLERP